MTSVLQEMRLKYNETAKNGKFLHALCADYDIFPPFLYFNSTEVDVMGELLVISDLLVKEMRKTDNHRLSVQEIYNLELTKLQSEKAANIRANLGHQNRFQDLLREKIDKNSRFAALNQVYELP